MVSYRGYTIPQSTDLTSLGHNIEYGSVKIKDPLGRIVDIGLSYDELKKVNNIDGYILERAKRYINASIGEFV